MKKLRLFADRDRVTRTRIAYIALTAGTVLIAFLLVLLNRWIFSISEAALYDDPKYEAVSIISADSIGAPLSLKTRVALFLQCERQGEERAVMPGELSADEVKKSIKELWTETLNQHAANGRLFTGESVDSVLRKSSYTATLRDFYHDESGAKLALWCAQAYYEADGGRVYCLSVQYDSRTGEAYALTCALYENVRTGQAERALIPFLTANGYADSLSEQAQIRNTQKGSAGTLALPDGLVVALTYDTGEQFTIVFTDR